MPTELLIESQLQEGEVIALQATNRQVLIDSIMAIVPEIIPKNGTLLHVELHDLGADYKTKDDIPEHSVPCPCGNPKHWLIKYTEN